MKKIFGLYIIQLLLLPLTFAGTGQMEEAKKAKGTAGVDETYVDEIKTRESAIQRTEADKAPAQKGQDRYGQIYSKEDDQQREEEAKATKRQKDREGEADGAEYDDKRVWR